ncbi:LacI family DNA-binding transcriptional regulator [Larsenimonas salina]|uniref:LacI family DNA-binding transcriptional regulator n=1 Tax=Larsenimonas salina TaxID=1295565 RepID=UPI002073E5BE|nr:LacI family DNA-binding transcriptional regulator [Larsenimonas salina]
MKKRETGASGQSLTLKEVAEHLGVSTATVSNAFNRPDQLSKTRRQEILAAAKALGYRGPDSRARSLRTGHSRIIGVMLWDTLSFSLSDSVASELLSGISEVLDEHDYRMLLLPQSARPAQRENFNGVADGYLVYGTMPDGTTERLQQGEFSPAVTIDKTYGSYPTICIDDRAASRGVAELALAKGKRRPAIVALRMTLDAPPGPFKRQARPRQFNAMAQARLGGFDDALTAAGIDPASVPIWNVDGNTFNQAVPVIEALLDGSTADTLLCMSDQLALAALAVAEQRGLDVPGALTITGFDGAPEGQQRRPMLTTVYQDNRAKGRLAARMILDQITEHDATLPTWLIHGDTC